MIRNDLVRFEESYLQQDSLVYSSGQVLMTLLIKGKQRSKYQYAAACWMSI